VLVHILRKWLGEMPNKLEALYILVTESVS